MGDRDFAREYLTWDKNRRALWDAAIAEHSDANFRETCELQIKRFLLREALAERMERAAIDVEARLVNATTRDFAAARRVLRRASHG